MKRLDTQLNELTNQIQIKSQKLLSQQIKNYYQTLRTSVIKKPLSPLYLHYISFLEINTAKFEVNCQEYQIIILFIVNRI